jgi:hypothetical protein
LALTLEAGGLNVDVPDLDLAAPSIQDRFVPYRLNTLEVLVFLLSMIAVAILTWSAGSEEGLLPGGPPLTSVLVAVGFLVFMLFKGVSLFVELKGHRDVYSTLRICQLVDLPLDDVFMAIEQFRATPLTSMFPGKPENPVTRAAWKAAAQWNPKISLRLGDQVIDDVQAHRFYKAAPGNRKLVGTRLISRDGDTDDCEFTYQVRCRLNNRGVAEKT